MAAPQPAEGWEELAYSLPGQWAGLGLDTRILKGAQAQSDPRGRAQDVNSHHSPELMTPRSRFPREAGKMPPIGLGSPALLGI